MVVTTKRVLTSTPKRHSSIIDPDCITPLRRKSLAATLITAETENDDEAERNFRRNAAELQRRVSIMNSPVPSQNSTPSVSGNALQGVNLQEHFDTCLRMFTQNKINAKNAWSLHIIDYLRTVVQSDVEIRSMLQVAGTSLDIGAKIYALRVDDLHSQTIKLANCLSRVNLNGQNRENDDDNVDDDDVENENDGEVQQEKTKKKKKRLLTTHGKRVTVVENEDNITAPISKLQSLYAQFETDSNTLLNTALLKSENNSFELLVGSRSKKSFMQLSPRERFIKQGPDVKLKIEPVPNKSICPAFSKFVIDEWDVEQDELDRSTLGNELYFNDDGLPLPNVDAENIDPNEGIDMDDDIVADELVDCGGQHGAIVSEYITDMRPGNSIVQPEQPLEYSYRPVPNCSSLFNLNGVWAGPSHWKLKYIRRTTAADAAGSVVVERNKHRRTRTFECVVIKEWSEKNWSDLIKLIPPAKKTVTRKTLQDLTDVITYPEDQHIKSEFWRFLITMPEWMSNLRHTPSNIENLASTSYNYNNPNDNEYCNQTIVEEDNWQNDDNDNACDGAEDFPEPTQNNCIDNGDLIDEPELVALNYVQYAKKAKNMDMKKLKKLMWEEISEQPEKDSRDKENTMQIDQDINIKPTTLKTIYNQIPSKMSKKMSENLSCPLAFVALLHLANENTLLIKNTTDLSDVTIEKDL